MPGCVHHWKIETNQGPYSPGTCKHCGQTRNFKNSYDETSYFTANGKAKMHISSLPLATNSFRGVSQ